MSYRAHSCDLIIRIQGTHFSNIIPGMSLRALTFNLNEAGFTEFTNDGFFRTYANSGILNQDNSTILVIRRNDTVAEIFYTTR
jgi:hypothetical protein